MGLCAERNFAPRSRFKVRNLSSVGQRQCECMHSGLGYLISIPIVARDFFYPSQKCFFCAQPTFHLFLLYFIYWPTRSRSRNSIQIQLSVTSTGLSLALSLLSLRNEFDLLTGRDLVASISSDRPLFLLAAYQYYTGSKTFQFDSEPPAITFQLLMPMLIEFRNKCCQNYIPTY